MDINLREAILQNVSGNDQSQLQATIVDAIEIGEEKMLPGLGVLFEIIWKYSDDNEKTEMVESLEKGIQQAK